jgi:hypothetical protein
MHVLQVLLDRVKEATKLRIADARGHGEAGLDVLLV